MDRRGFLNGLVGTALGFLEPGCSRVIVLDASLTINNDDAGRLIPPDFKGLSYESSILASGDYFAPDNASVVGLIRSLGDNGIIRIGGNTSERTVWRPESKPGPDDFEITPASIDRLAATLSILGWRLIYGLNLARGTPQAAAPARGERTGRNQPDVPGTPDTGPGKHRTCLPGDRKSNVVSHGPRNRG